MRRPVSDAIVFFGATGALACKQIFPSLRSLVRDEGLDVPIIRVANAGRPLDQLKARVKDSLASHGRLDTKAFAKLTIALGPRVKHPGEGIEGVELILTERESVVLPVTYEQGSWGPEEANGLIGPDGPWHNSKPAAPRP